MLKESTSRHAQITEWLRGRIETGEFDKDEKLPSENELAERFDVSRVTVRRALQTLEGEGVIYRSQGLGSFVSDRRSSHRLIRLTDFHEDMMNAGLAASSNVLSQKLTEAPDWLAALLQVKEGAKVVQIDRLRLGDGEPVAFDRTWLAVFYGQLLNEKDLADKTIYKILEEEYEIPVLRGCYRISAEAADADLAGILDIKQKTPVLLIDRITYTVADKPVYYQKRFYRNDKVTYEMRLERDPGKAYSSTGMPLKEFLPIFTSKKPG